MLLSSHILLAVQAHFVFAQALIPPPPTDQTGVNAALIAIARRGAALIGGAITIYLVYHGLAYLGSDDTTRGAHVKRMFTVLAISAIIVLAAVTIAPQFTTAILTGQ